MEARKGIVETLLTHHAACGSCSAWCYCRRQCSYHGLINFTKDFSTAANGCEPTGGSPGRIPQGHSPCSTPLTFSCFRQPSAEQLQVNEQQAAWLGHSSKDWEQHCSVAKDGLFRCQPLAIIQHSKDTGRSYAA